VTDGTVTQGGGVGESTSLGLLERARFRDPAAWHRLVQLYAPLIHRWCCRAHLQEADAADIRQDVFLAVSRCLNEFQRSTRGSFRGWLRTITRNKIRDLWRRKGYALPAVGGGDTDRYLDELPTADEGDSEGPEVAEERSVVYWRALELIEREFEERSWRAFWRVVIEEGRPADVASELGMTVNAVYLAKSRVLARLRTEFAGVFDD
jgi:RNA polymerase sigma-70 factor (ECF subfamily)